MDGAPALRRAAWTGYTPNAHGNVGDEVSSERFAVRRDEEARRPGFL
jgi:hypothetical protein